MDPTIPTSTPTPQDQPLDVNAVTPPQQEPLPVDVETSSPPISPETADNRAQKFKYGLGDLLQKSKDDIYGDIVQGNEYGLREQAASEIDKRKYDAVQKLFVDVANRKGSDLTDEEKSGLASMVQEMNAKTDPKTVLETAYGKQFIAQLDRTAQGSPDDNVLNQAIMEDPNAVADIMNNHGTMIAKNQVIDTLIQDANDTLHHQGYLSWGIDMAKSAIPGYSDYMMRGNVREVGVFAGLGMGNNLEEQRQTLLRLPVDELQTRLSSIYENLKSSDPSQALAFLQYMKGVSSDATTLKNLQTPFEFATTGIAAKGAKVAIGAAKSALGKSAVKDVETAAGQMVRAAADPQATKSTIEAASGDLTESAVTRATANAVSDVSGATPAAKTAIEQLSTTYRADLENIRANPGYLGQDIVNRITESANNVYRQMVDAVVNTQKVDRLPDVLANETTVRAVVDSIKNTYRGLKNTVLDVSKPYRDEVSNTHLIDLYVGQTDGTYFKNRQVAENFIKTYGLKGDIGQGADIKYTKPVVETAKLEKKIGELQQTMDNIRAGKTSLPEDKRPEQLTGMQEFLDKYNKDLDTWRASKQTASVEQQGLGYYVKITKPIDETQPVIRQALAATADTKIPDSPVAQFLNSWIGKIRTPEEVLSKAERQNRLTATYAPSNYLKIMVENAKEINKLQAGRFSKGRKRWDEWQRGLENAQELPDPNATGVNKRGYFFQSPADMEHYWQQWFHRLPDEQEIAAYFEFKRGMEIDRTFRNIAEHRNQQRVGAETVRVTTKNGDGSTAFSPEFSGVLRKKIPGAEDNILIMGEKLGEERVVPLERQTTAWKKEQQAEIDKGTKQLIEVYAPELRPLNGFGNIADSRVRYVLADTTESRPLDWNHIARRGGGHIQYDHDWYIKQAKITHDDVGNRFWYEGDTTIMAAMQRGVGETVAKHLDEVRKFMKDKNYTAARDYSNANLHMDWDQVQGWFKGGKNNDGIYEPPRLSLNDDIRLVPKNSKISDIDNNLRSKYVNFKDGTREGSLSRQNRVEFAEERDGYELLQADLEGTKYSPLYKVTPAKAVDPITTMNRGLERIARSNFMDDYKTMAVEHWLKQAAPFLDVKSEGELYASPFYYFNEGKFRAGALKEHPNIVAQLEASKYHTQQLTGQPSLVDGLLHSAAQKMSDMAVNAIGPKGQVLTPTALMPFLRDPLAYVRSAAYNVKLGLFNLPQFIVQAGNYSNILGIAGYKYASPGTLAAQLHFWTGLNKSSAIIDHLDSLASKFNLPGTAAWKPGEFKEAFLEGEKTGFHNVAGEYAMLDNPNNNKIITTAKDTFLDWGQTPFKKGEENARFGAWYTAFKEFRDANPLGRITQADRAQILQRADLLNVNMSRASTSMLNKGAWSIPTQFYTYQMRLLELFFGSRLTAAEKGRMFLTNAILYGAPMATGLTGIPAADWLRQKSMEEGYVVGDNFIKSMLMEGVPSAIGAIITGKGDPQAGTWYDVGPRFGTKGFDFLGGLTKTDKGYLDMLGGPVYSIAKDTIAQTDGFARAMISLARRDEDVFPMTFEDIIDPLKEITSVNTAWRDMAIANGGRWVSKKDAYLADASGWNAIVSSTLGLKDQSINDIQTLRSSIQDQKAYETEIENKFRQEFRRGVISQKDNPEMAKKFFTRAQAWLTIGGYREDRIQGLVGRAISDNQSVLDKLNFDFYIRKTPDADKESRMDAMKRTLQIQDKKRGDQ